MKKKKFIWLIIPVILIVGYVTGPKVTPPKLTRELPVVPADLQELEEWVGNHEKSTPGIKPDNESRIIWANEPYVKTPYALVYLHGWSASQAEGAPLHTEIAERYGMNLYLPRLFGHGLEDARAMQGLTADSLLYSAREAVAIASGLGEEVIILSTSTGGTLSLYLAPELTNLAGLILYSPNIQIHEPTAELLDDPWGYQIARLVTGSDMHTWQIEPERKPFWSNKYPLVALTHLQALVSATMNERTYQQVEVPVFMGYYFKNDSLQDQTVSVPAMLEMFEMLGTPDNMKVKQAFPEVGGHVIGSYLVSRDLPAVRQATFQFIEGKLGILPDSAFSSFNGTSQSE